MEKKKIFVVDDEEDLCEILKYNLEQAGFEVTTAFSAEEALLMNVNSFDLILLDVMMGEMSGFKMAEIIRKSKHNPLIPIIFCTAKDDEEDTLRGLELGGDDYILKPFSVKEVVARVNSVLRRTQKQIPEKHKEDISFDGITITFEQKKVIINGKALELTKTEFELLSLFLKNREKVFSREELLAYIWQDDVFVSERTVDVHITRLRKKIAPYGKNIQSRSGYGYCFCAKT
jgi:DNA-binding response OmpR family regulator